MSKIKKEDEDEPVSAQVKSEVKQEEDEPVSAIEVMSKVKEEKDEPSPAKQPKLEVKQEDGSDSVEQARLSPIELDGAGDGCEGGNEQESSEQQLSAQKREMLTDFMAIANAEESAALSILESTNWDVNKAINFYFGNEDSANENDEEDVQVLSSTAGSTNHQTGPIDLTGLEISLVSWNVDGLDGNSLATRMKAVYKIVSNLNPDFVFLQEVVLRELPTIDRLTKLYNIYYSNMDFPYFTAILVSKSFEVESHDVIHYQNSGMGRTLQIIKGRIGEQEVYLLNTHLESMKDHSRARKEQFQICMEKIRDIISSNPNCLLFFGGDLNIRDDEISNVPRGLADAWLASGANKQTEFTWDTRKNDNKQSFGARCRFDRIFWYGPLTRVKFSLAGQQRIRSCLCFPSDHWAVHCEFS
ncbi:unnamed protein product [Cylicocyclus nassatus]|uniref:Endonuclease/exonuclease/phosphatase domain-containing protein n=1 Tax=Cylicocyclus nassatus TaxID=53992 RepID=A0AA36GIL2_CYLNA|nr:unnamed protein product [Cylicocyclus nassatus]